MMSQQLERRDFQSDEIDLRELLIILWQGKWLLMLFTCLFAILGLAYVMYKPATYQAEILVAPVSDDAKIGGIGGQIGGIASLAGIDLGGSNSNQAVIAKKVLESRAFLANFIRRHELEVLLWGVKGWNQRENKAIYDRDLYDPENRKWLSNDENQILEPTDWELVSAFKANHFSLAEEKGTGMLRLSVKYYSPIIAAQWARRLIEDINEHMRGKDVEEAEASIAYLEGKLSQTNIVGMQKVFYQLIEGEIRKVMLANGRTEYVFETVAPAVVPEEKAGPQRILILALAVVFGLALGAATVLLKHLLKSKESEN